MVDTLARKGVPLRTKEDKAPPSKEKLKKLFEQLETSVDNVFYYENHYLRGNLKSLKDKKFRLECLTAALGMMIERVERNNV